jgi:hypothetical protein
MAEHDMDAIGAEASAMMKTMLQLATLVALRTRERGQKEAEQRVKVTQARLKEAKELTARQVRESKARDPRNLELQRMIERSGVVLTKDRAALRRDNQELERESRELGREQGDLTMMAVGVEAQRNEVERELGTVTLMERPTMEFDSPERRLALALELAELGVEPELIEVRMLAEMAQGRPLVDAAREPITGPTPMAPVRDLDLTRERYRER